MSLHHRPRVLAINTCSCFFVVAIGLADALLLDRTGYAPQQSRQADLAQERGSLVNSTLLSPEMPTIVEFGVLLKHFYGLEMSTATFKSDSIISSRWTDKRNADVIPAGEDSIWLTAESAQDQMWMPDIKVTNFAPGGYTIVSSSVLVEAGGVTTTIQRALLTTAQAFDYTEFPFDHQALQIKVASGSYMDDEVQLTPFSNTSYWGAQKSLFDAYILLNSTIYTIVETDGLLSKSRGVLELDVKRTLGQTISTVFVPSTLLLAMTWSSVWLPLSAPFAMPRLALNSFALLGQVTLANHMHDQTPQGKITWLDQYLESCFTLQFIVLFLNTIMLSLKHKYNDEYAEVMAHHMFILFPVLQIINQAVLQFDANLSPAFIAIFCLSYAIYTVWEFYFDENSRDSASEAGSPRKKSESSSASPTKT